MLLIVGLGNPGPEHARQRHNIGFMAAERIVERHGFGAYRSRFQGLVAEGRLDHHQVRILKPMTYMNESGRSVGEAARFFKLAPEQIVVLQDEIDLAAGKLRIKRGGGHAGHNGLRSIHAHIGPDYRRIRLGVGHPGAKHKVSRHVLGDFAKADRDWLDKFLDAVAEAAPFLAADDDAGFATRVALILKPPTHKPKPEPPPGAAVPGAEDGPGEDQA